MSALEAMPLIEFHAECRWSAPGAFEGKCTQDVCFDTSLSLRLPIPWIYQIDSQRIQLVNQFAIDLLYFMNKKKVETDQPSNP
ncbi:hypothetical protein GDO81_002981 [Engystomops pustulosus]|uniref:Uncharacterized protein n=1 Tax=Engystomops pustulosus TaxID=76066 RepID=A0AAV7DP04_ENGPU|nr:hypothetical protein GDO81_002981 [Engystomops pustulosus]